MRKSILLAILTAGFVAAAPQPASAQPHGWDRRGGDYGRWERDHGRHRGPEFRRDRYGYGPGYGRGPYGYGYGRPPPPAYYAPRPAYPPPPGIYLPFR